jgi:mevalonate kinase
LTGGEYYSRGKFLLSGEYLVLYGAKALAIPLKFGQRMVVSTLPETGLLKWETFVHGKLWFTAGFNLKDLEILETTDQKTAAFIQNLLKAGGKLRPDLRLSNCGYHIQNHIEFDISWGLGSSSSLVSNLAYWLGIDPFSLYRSAFQGSGYDIFCSRADKPIIYQLKEGQPFVQESSFNPAFLGHLYFVYSGRKQDSQVSVEKFRAIRFHDDKLILAISELTETMIEASSFVEFQAAMNCHEEILSAVLGLKPVKELLFPDFEGQIKSLGAWGGDFVMAATEMSEPEVRNYFKRKNLEIVFKWIEIVY